MRTGVEAASERDELEGIPGLLQDHPEIQAHFRETVSLAAVKADLQAGIPAAMEIPEVHPAAASWERALRFFWERRSAAMGREPGETEAGA